MVFCVACNNCVAAVQELQRYCVLRDRGRQEAQPHLHALRGPVPGRGRRPPHRHVHGLVAAVQERPHVQEQDRSEDLERVVMYVRCPVSLCFKHEQQVANLVCVAFCICRSLDQALERLDAQPLGLDRRRRGTREPGADVGSESVAAAIRPLRRAEAIPAEAGSPAAASPATASPAFDTEAGTPDSAAASDAPPPVPVSSGPLRTSATGAQGDARAHQFGRVTLQGQAY